MVGSVVPGGQQATLEEPQRLLSELAQVQTQKGVRKGNPNLTELSAWHKSKTERSESGTSPTLTQRLLAWKTKTRFVRVGETQHSQGTRMGSTNPGFVGRSVSAEDVRGGIRPVVQSTTADNLLKVSPKRENPLRGQMQVQCNAPAGTFAAHTHRVQCYESQ